MWWWAYPEIKSLLYAEQSINTVCVSLMSDVSMGGEPRGGKLLKTKPELESQTAVRQMFFKLSDTLTLCLNSHCLSGLTRSAEILSHCLTVSGHKKRMDVKRRRVYTRNMQHKGHKKTVIVDVTSCIHVCLFGFVRWGI